MRDRFVYIAAPVLLVVLLSVSSLCAVAQPERTATLFAMDEAVEIVLSRHPTLAVDDAVIAARSAARRSAFGAFLPSVDARGSWTRYLNEVGAVSEGTELASSRPPTELTAGVSIGLLIFDGFARSSQYNARNADLESARLQREADEVTLAFDTRRVFLSILGSRAHADAIRSAIATLGRQRARLAERIQLGVLPGVDLTLLDADVARMRHSLVLTENEVSANLATLSALLDMPVGTSIDVTSRGVRLGMDSGERGPMFDTLEALSARSGGTSSRVAMLTTSVLAAEEGAAAARAGYYPQVGASLGYGLYSSGPISQTSGTLGLNLTYNLFDGFRTDEAVAQAEAGVRRARAELRAGTRQVAAESEAVVLRLQAAERALISADAALAAAQIRRRSVTDRIEAGAGRTDDLLTATQALIDARVASIEAGTQWWISFYDVVRQLGVARLPMQ